MELPIKHIVALIGLSAVTLCVWNLQASTRTVTPRDLLRLTEQLQQYALSTHTTSSSSLQQQQQQQQSLVTAVTVVDWDSIDHVFYYHTRKAAGTTLVKWVRAVAFSKNKTFTSDEGFVFDRNHPQPMFPAVETAAAAAASSENKAKIRTLYVTSLRPPVDRALSSYSFEFAHAKKGRVRTIPEFVRYSKRMRRNEKWDNRVGRGPLLKGHCWICADECYSKWFGWPTLPRSPEENDPQRQYAYQHNTTMALQVLERFDIIFMKNLKFRHYMDWLLRHFDTTIQVPHFRPTVKPKTEIAQSDINLLDEHNKQDNQLYNTLRDKWNKIVAADLGNSSFQLI